MPVPIGTKITIRIPDDFHHHCRDGKITETIIQHISERFGRCLIMPNLKPPVVTTNHAIQYKQHIINCYNKVRKMSNSVTTTTTTEFEPLMTLYLTESMTPDEIYKAVENNSIIGVKYYPAGATTNSDYGVSDIKKCYPVLKALDKLGLVLCIHSEITYGIYLIVKNNL
jgi:dihydroorotase